MTLPATQRFVIKTTGGKISKKLNKNISIKSRELEAFFLRLASLPFIMQPSSKLLLAGDAECPIVNLQLEKNKLYNHGLEKCKTLHHETNT